MLTRDLWLTFVLGIVMVLLVLGLHAVLKYYNALADAEYSLIGTFAATFASTISPSLSGLYYTTIRPSETKTKGTSSSGGCWQRGCTRSSKG
jgi:hypothetical protein